jgi:spore coat protein H
MPLATKPDLLPRATLLALMLAGLGLLQPIAWAATQSHGKAKARQTDAFFADSNVTHFKIEVTASNLAMIRADPRRDVRATVRVGDEVFTDVALHLKGAAGSFRSFDDRPALTLNFDKFKPKQHFHGLEKFHLNNSIQDPSYLSEAVCAELFLAAGVPTPRATHARLTLNGRDLGLYVLKEGFNKQFLARFFLNNRGNLYDGGFLTDISEPLVRDSGEGDVTNRADLKALAAAARLPDPRQRWEALQRTLDVDRFVSFLALEVLTWHWDGYALKRNNYRVYHNPDDGRLVFFAHGLDQMFWEPEGPLQPNFEALVAQAVTETPQGRRLYCQRVAALLTNVFTAGRITNHVAQLQARVQPALRAISANAASQQANAAANFQRQALARLKHAWHELDDLDPGPLLLDAGGSFHPIKWQSEQAQGQATLDRPTVGNGLPTLHIAIGPGQAAVASWRSQVRLEPGRYVFVVRAKTRGVKPLPHDGEAKGPGAGIRVSGTQSPRTNQLTGDQDWKSLEYEFTVAGGEPVVLVAELRANGGEVWFDRDSLNVRRK